MKISWWVEFKISSLSSGEVQDWLNSDSNQSGAKVILGVKVTTSLESPSMIRVENKCSKAHTGLVTSMTGRPGTMCMTSLH